MIDSTRMQNLQDMGFQKKKKTDVVNPLGRGERAGTQVGHALIGSGVLYIFIYINRWFM